MLPDGPQCPKARTLVSLIMPSLQHKPEGPAKGVLQATLCLTLSVYGWPAGSLAQSTPDTRPAIRRGQQYDYYYLAFNFCFAPKD